ncbi:hypothetical protein Bbelb_170320 [Branchiostoma belcheri]|nr:hypothetical protein Bbelb_170320 [Branchiostoma belcheri]
MAGDGIRKTDNELVEKLVKGVVGRTFESEEEVLKFVREIDAARNVTVKYGTDTSNCSSSLDYTEALLFCLTIVTTIGYGHVPITTDAGKIFCCFYAFLGIPLTLTMLAAIGGKLADGNRFLEDQVKKRLAFLKTHPETIRFVNILILTTVNLGLFFFLPAYVFLCLETDWSYLDALYYVFITLSTVGFGDYVATLEPRTVGFGDYVATLEPRPTYAQNVAYKTMGVVPISFSVAPGPHSCASTIARHGFRKAHSCETQLLLTVDDLVSAHDNKLQVDMGILDFSRAFDTVPHERLVSKLAHYGIRGPILDWIRSFLQNRSMWVVADGECSPSTCVLSGVPQGTVLGPLLFLIYINDLPSRLSPGTTARLFADDCLIYREIRGQGDQVILQKDLIALQDWAATWGMKFNPKKCNTMSITRNKNPFTWMYEMCGEFIHQTEQAKYLGITISNDLKWSTHISTAVTRANHTLHFLSRNLRYCPRQVRETAYFSLVRSTIEYGAVIWDPYLRKDIDTLEMVNRRAARFVTSNHRRQDVSVTALLHDLRWPSLQSRRQQARLVMMYKITNGLVAIPPSRLIPAVARTRANHAHKYKTLRPHCDIAKYSFYARTIPEWNNLSADIGTFCWILTGLCFLASVFDLLVEEMKGIEERITEGMAKPSDGDNLDNEEEMTDKTEQDIQGHTKKEEEQGEGMSIRVRTSKKAAVSSEEIEEAGTCLPDKEKHA